MENWILSQRLQSSEGVRSRVSYTHMILADIFSSAGEMIDSKMVVFRDKSVWATDE